MRRVLALSCALFLSGCSITRIVEPDFEHLSPQAQAGDTAKITKHDGEYLVLRVVRVEQNALIGTTGKRRALREHRVEYAEIHELKVIGRGLRRFTTPEKVGIVAVATMAGLLVLTFLALVL